jgi:hypothetical protein
MQRLKAPSTATVRWILIGSVLVTALHYTDNAISIADYPQPGWIHRETVYLAWSLFTLVGVAGYMLYRSRRTAEGGLYLFVYSYTGLSSLGHYWYGSANDFTTKMHLFIWTDVLAGLVVAGCAVWILVTRRSASEA